MWMKQILRAFDPSTRIKHYINGRLVDDFTVKDFMDSGLTAYAQTTDGSLAIEDGVIIYHNNN